MVGGPKKEEKTVQVRKAPSKKKPPATTPIAKKKGAGKVTTPDIEISKDSTTQTGPVDRSVDLSMKKKSTKVKSSGRLDKIAGIFKKKPGGRNTPRTSKKDLAKTPETTKHAEAPTAETVKSETSPQLADEKTKTKGKLGDEKMNIQKSRGRKGKGDNQEKISNIRKREKQSGNKGAQTPKKEESKEESKEGTMDVDDEGESKLIPMDKIQAKGSGRKGKPPPASTPQAEVEKKEREGRGKEKTIVTARKKPSACAAITTYEAGADKALVRLSTLRQLEDRKIPDFDEDFRSNHKINAEVNRDTRYVISFNVPPDGDFYDANKVDIPGVENKFIIAAAPTTEISSRENFWRMVYDATVANIFYVEDYKPTAPHFVPWKAGEARDYGKMFVSNKKSTEGKEGKQSVLEVLPEGCSNSIIVRFAQCLKWPDALHRDIKNVSLSKHLNHPLQYVRLIKDDKGLTMVVCATGCGKSAMFIMLHAAITTLNNLNPVPMHDILQKVRHDRWGAIQTMEQYLALYQLYIYYIAAKSKQKSDVSVLCNELYKMLVTHPIKK